jgi:hypothetical protein
MSNKRIEQTSRRARSTRADADWGGLQLIRMTMARTATRRAIGAADYHPLSVRRFAPAIKRLQRTVVHASQLARPPAADPQPRWAVSLLINENKK